MHSFSLIEPLEDRIAPASLINANTVTYTDIDGDTVVVKTSKPVFLNATVANAILTFTNAGGVQIPNAINGNNAVPQQLALIDFTGSAFTQSDAAVIRSIAAETNLSVTALSRLGSFGNGQADVGYIRATLIDAENFDFYNNIDLGTVTIDGDLGRIDVGDSNVDAAVKSLNVASMGKTNSQLAGDSSVLSNFFGPISSLHVTGDINGARLHVLGGQFGNIGKLTIDGALRGGTADNSGQIAFTGKLGTAVIGDIVGAAGKQSGSVIGNLNNATRPSAISSIRVLGSVTGGAGTDSGEIAAFNLSAVHIDHDLVPSVAGNESGFIFGKNSIGTVKIGGSITGGGMESAGGILSNGPINSVNISGNVTGGTEDSTGRIAGTVIGKIQIGGNLAGGMGDDSASIFASTSIGSLKIGGNVTGGVGMQSARIFTGTLGSLSVGGEIQGGDGNDSGQVLTLSLPKATIGTNLEGGAGDYSGAVISAKIGSLTINNSLKGGSGAKSGFVAADVGTIFNKIGSIVSDTSIGSLKIVASVEGGSGNSSGEILVSGTLGKTTIGGNLTGGNVDSADELSQSGYIEAMHITDLTVGDVTAGSNAGTGGISSSGAIRATQDIEKITLTGDLSGSDPLTGGTHAIISAAGFVGQFGAVTTDLAIKGITIMGDMVNAEILAGYDTNASSLSPRGDLVDGDAQIGTVHIFGDMTDSSIAAGVDPGDDFFGDANDTAGPDNISEIFSKIASVIVGGTATGTSDSYGIVAQWVESVSIGGTPVTLTPGPSNDTGGVVIGGTLSVLEV